ncbi:hypothetical protein GE061_003231 [Apolygus lucorum]|uniref:Cystatin domain-containing protein n=1 Tax=Apolygus lucorum TaxID=248454 RepID=A0A8S9X406_APOLU|nr:hypothetical protein GE061_003231 [Apolygus lucorum]
MMNLALLVGIAACVVFAPTGSEADQVVWEDIRPTPALMDQLREVIAHKNPFVIPVAIIRARMQVGTGFNYDVMFLSATNRLCRVWWHLKRTGLRVQWRFEEPRKMMKLAFLVASVVFATTGSAATLNQEEIGPTPELMKQLKKLVAEKYPHVTSFKIIKVIKNTFAQKNGDIINFWVTIKASNNQICRADWWSRPNKPITYFHLSGCN